MGVETSIDRLRGGCGVVASASFMPSASAYGAGDVIDGPKEFIFRDFAGAIVPAGTLIRLLSSVLKIGQTALQSSEAVYSLPLFSVTPPSDQADNAAYTLDAADLTAYRGMVTLGTPVDLGGACYIKRRVSETDEQDFNLTGNSLWGRLVTAPGFTPGAVARQVFLYGMIV